MLNKDKMNIDNMVELYASKPGIGKVSAVPEYAKGPAIDLVPDNGAYIPENYTTIDNMVEKKGVLGKLQAVYDYMSRASVTDSLKDAYSFAGNAYDGIAGKVSNAYHSAVDTFKRFGVDVAENYHGVAELNNALMKKDYNGLKKIGNKVFGDKFGNVMKNCYDALKETGNNAYKALDIFKEKSVQVKNFTLIELLTVVTVISILAALLLPALNKGRERAHEINNVNNLKQIMLTNSMYENDFKTYPTGNPTDTFDMTDGLVAQLKAAGYTDVAKNKQLFYDHFATNPVFKHQFFYIHNSAYSQDAGAASIEFVNGLDKYNPKTYQLFSVGKDGKTASTKTHSTVQDNIWAIPGANAVKIFRDIKDQQGK